MLNAEWLLLTSVRTGAPVGTRSPLLSLRRAERALATVPRAAPFGQAPALLLRTRGRRRQFPLLTQHAPRRLDDVEQPFVERLHARVVGIVRQYLAEVRGGGGDVRPLPDLMADFKDTGIRHVPRLAIDCRNEKSYCSGQRF